MKENYYNNVIFFRTGCCKITIYRINKSWE